MKNTFFQIGLAGKKCALVTMLSMGMMGFAQAEKPMPVKAVEQLELDRYLGVWYEIARKPLSFQNKCEKNVTARYTLNENGNVNVDNRCVTQEGTVTQSIGEAFIENPPANSQLKVSFLPEILRWLPMGRGDYWVLKIDENYQTVLVGEPKRKYLWLLSRQPQLDKTTMHQYLKYAESMGYELQDLIYTKQSTP